MVCRTRSAHAAAPSGKCSRSRKAKNSFSAWFLLPDHFILSLTSDEQRMYVQPRKGLGPGPGQGICCSPRTSLPTVTALPCVFLLLVAFEQARPCEETRGSEATVRLAQWCTCPRLGHEANFWHPSRAHARTRTWRPRPPSHMASYHHTLPRPPQQRRASCRSSCRTTWLRTAATATGTAK